MRGVRAAVLGLLLAGAACGGAAADHERLGDRHYRASRYAQALAEYSAAQRSAPRPEVWAKAGAAALRAGNAGAAIDAFEHLAAEDPARVAESVRGLERAARLAQQQGAGGIPMVVAAVTAIRRLAPDRPLGRLAAEGAGAAARKDAARMLPAAIAAAGGREEVDRLLVQYAEGLRAATSCEPAVRAYRTVLRRAATAEARAAAQSGLTWCALRLGLDALATGRLDMAEQWLAEASAADSAGAVGLRARIAWGEARLGQGDVLGAAIAWQAVMSAASAPDSLRQLAIEKLNALGHAGPPDARKDSVP